MNEIMKRAVFFLIFIVVASVTLYLVLATLNLNRISDTKGPVHWHADFEIRVCGNEVKLAEPEGFSNRQGTSILHAHSDNRIHVEGVLVDKKLASLGNFFYAVGGYIGGDALALKVPTDKGLMFVHYGDNCNGKPGSLYVFVNGRLIDNPADYIISPYEKVPPGDRIKIVFTEKPAEEINPNIGQNGS